MGQGPRAKRRVQRQLQSRVPTARPQGQMKGLERHPCTKGPQKLGTSVNFGFPITAYFHKSGDLVNQPMSDANMFWACAPKENRPWVHFSSEGRPKQAGCGPWTLDRGTHRPESGVCRPVFLGVQTMQRQVSKTYARKVEMGQEMKNGSTKGFLAGSVEKGLATPK